jgi:hypothetical protein
MPRSPRAYLIDVIDACDAIAAALRKVELSRYESDRLIRSAVEREFILIGEALASGEGRRASRSGLLTVFEQVLRAPGLTRAYPMVRYSVRFAGGPK